MNIYSLNTCITQACSVDGEIQSPVVKVVIEELREKYLYLYDMTDSSIFRYLGIFGWNMTKLSNFLESNEEIPLFLISLVYSNHWSDKRIEGLSADRLEYIVWNISRFVGLSTKYAVDLFFHLLQDTNIYSTPSIIFNTQEQLWACDENELINEAIFMWESNDFIAIEVDGVIIGHVKLKGEDTFISYVDSIDSKGNISLIKGGIYTLGNWNEITSIKIPATSEEVYVYRAQELDVNFLRLSLYENIDELMDNFKKQIKQHKLVYVAL